MSSTLTLYEASGTFSVADLSLKNYMRFKRMFDLTLASMLLIPAGLVALFVAILVKLSSRGPILFAQKRLGRDGKAFIIYKFRTMAENSAKPFDCVTDDDERVTRIGKLLRKLHADELPQLWNVICGDMSFVGPRPLSEDLIMKFSNEVPGFPKRLLMDQGITGMVQVKGRIEKLPGGAPEAFELDMKYFEQRCLWLDLKLIAKTILAVFRRQGC